MFVMTIKVMIAGGLMLALSNCASQAVKHFEPSPSPSLVETSQAMQKAKTTEELYEFNAEQGEVTLASGAKIVEKEFSEENAKLKYRNSVSYPQFVGALNASQETFNTAVMQRAKREFDEYRIEQLKPRSNAERFPKYHEDVEEVLQVSYDLPLVDQNQLSVRFWATTYGRGAAHPVDYFFVFNFDLNSGKELRLTDLFSEPKKALSVISAYCRKVVTEGICREGGWAGKQSFEDCLSNAPLWEQGIEPTVENYKAWNITRDGLVISFEPCQLTGCASGEFYVVVPYSEMQAVMWEKSVLRLYAR